MIVGLCQLVFSCFHALLVHPHLTFWVKKKTPKTLILTNNI